MGAWLPEPAAPATTNLRMGFSEPFDSSG